VLLARAHLAQRGRELGQCQAAESEPFVERRVPWDVAKGRQRDRGETLRRRPSPPVTLFSASASL